MVARAAVWNAAQRQRLRAAVLTYLKKHPCEDCGERGPVVLEFDRNAATKKFNISVAVRQAYSLATVMAEIAKCDVRCANCHRRKTSKQLSWASR